MPTDKKILISGAGPSGLSSALFLHELGYQPRIIDKKTAISPFSKALGVNPRTLELFEPLGITDRFLANGRKMTALNIWKKDRHIFKNDLTKVHHRYPFMLIQPQKDSEEILLEELKKRGIEPEFGTELIGLQSNASKVSVQLKNHSDSLAFDYVVGADGGHSLVRESVGIQNKGFRYDAEWKLYDIELDTPLPPDEGHIILHPEGGMIMIRLKENIWRIAGNIAPLNYLPNGTQTGTIHWESRFRIHHKVARSLTSDNVVLIGDAAHLHSPVGARGMNLGIEDAYISTRLLHEGKLSDYTKLRKPYLTTTVNRINAMTTGVAGDSPAAKFFRRRTELLSWVFPFVMPSARKFVMGIN